MPNHLISETSPYLLQHAYNPVDWYPWGSEALQKARDEDKPIFLSIGYSACHWCHVMERESFEDESIAGFMNEHFVCIKVDREERPDLDAIYMDAVVALTGRGGWPLSVWLTPDARPYFGGTYFPPRTRPGLPSFRQMLEMLSAAWRDQPAEVMGTAVQVVERVKASAERILSRTHSTGSDPGSTDAERGDAVGTAFFEQALEKIDGMFDWEYGGWGGGPKFPQPMLIEFLLAAHAYAGMPDALPMARKVLDDMAAGGVYDHLGHGFHRYSTDDRWLVPHFEKMLYDNAQLARAYLHAWQLTAEPRYRQVVEETLDYILRDMVGEEGGFFSAQDADSEGVEGKFYAWDPSEFREVIAAGLPEPEAVEAVCRFYGVTDHGDLDGRAVLRRTADKKAVAQEAGLTEAALDDLVGRARALLLEARTRRVPPARDDKVIAGWNGLALAAFAEAGRALDRSDYLAAASRNADFLARTMLADGADGPRLHRTYRDGVTAHRGCLEDYAAVAEGLLTLYQATFDERWFDAARSLTDTVLTHFTSPDAGFFDTSDEHETLIARPRALQDHAMPCGNSLMATAMLKLGALTGEARHLDPALEALRAIHEQAGGYPLAFGQWLLALQLASEGIREVAIVGEPASAETSEMLRVVFTRYDPALVAAFGRPGTASTVPLLEGREPISGRTTAWMCEHFACRAPVTRAADLEQQLGQS